MERLIFNLLILFKWIVYLSVISSILVLSILLIKKLLNNRLSVKIQYIMWFFIIVRLVIPVLPKSSFSVFNLIPINRDRPPVISVVDEPNYDKNFINNKSVKSNKITNSENKKVKLEFNTYNKNLISFINRLALKIKIPFFIWLIGAFIIGLYTIIVDVKFFSKVNKNKLVTDEKILNILEECKKSMKIKKHIDIIELSEIKSPALFSLINPKILLPINLIKNIGYDDFHYIFFHELSHFKRKDILINYLIRILCVFYWFNPLMWYAFYKMKQDMEICCDEMALNYVYPGKEKEYGYAMINLIEHCNSVPKIDMIAGMLDSKSNFKKRITNIKLFRRNSRKNKIISIIMFLVCLGFMLTEADISFAKFNNKDIVSKYVVDKDGISKRIDYVDYKFINDPEIIGKWHSVDFVENKSKFKPGKKYWKEDLYIKEMEFLQNGKIKYYYFTWTKGKIINKIDKTTGKYFIRDINGEKYMFLQWKNGDYIFRNRIPYYYVLKKSEA